MTNFLTATLALASSPLVIIGGLGLVCAVGYCALVDQARRRDARTKAENERRRAIHPSGRDVSKRTVHIAADWRDLWAELDYYEEAQ